MPLLGKLNKAFRFLLCVTDIFSKYACDVILKQKNILQLLALFKKFATNCKPSKIWEDKGSVFYCRSIKSWLEDNDIEKYLTHR